MSVHIDCATCVVRGLACHDCVVTVLLGPPPEVGFDDEEARALDVLAGSGLVPPLRMVAPQDGPILRTQLPDWRPSGWPGTGAVPFTPTRSACRRLR